jgi:hypothetical protein
MERLLKYKFSTATLGEKKANVKREVVFALLSPLGFYISRGIPEAIRKTPGAIRAKQICGLRNPMEITETPAGNPMVYSYFSRRRRIDMTQPNEMLYK